MEGQEDKAFFKKALLFFGVSFGVLNPWTARDILAIRKISTLNKSEKRNRKGD